MLAAAGLVPMGMPAPKSYTVSYDPPPFPVIGPGGAPAVNFADRGTGTVYLQRGVGRFGKAHEIGHLFDDQILTDRDRARLVRVMGHRPAKSWLDDDGTAAPSEWFADYYAAAATHLNLNRTSVSSYAQLTPHRLERFERLMGRMARNRRLPLLRLSSTPAAVALAKRGV